MASEFEFKITGWTPETIPQARLGEYLVKVARLYGEAENVRFGGVRKGSVVLRSRVEGPAIPRVQRRLMEVRRGVAPEEATEAFHAIDDMLVTDKAVGVLRGRGDDRGIVISFPGRDRKQLVAHTGIREDGFLEGELIRIGGRDETIHLALQSGDTVYSTIVTDRDMARRLGPLIFGPTIRLQGAGTWARSSEGNWTLTRFVVASFVEIPDVPLADALADIRAIGGSRWHLEDDPMKALEELRANGGLPS